MLSIVGVGWMGVDGVIEDQWIGGNMFAVWIDEL